MKKIWIMMCAVCFLMVGCNMEEPVVPSETVAQEEINIGTEETQGETALVQETTESFETIVEETNNAVGIGGYQPCIHEPTFHGHNLDLAYHTLSGPLCKIVDQDELEKWKSEKRIEFQAAYERGERSCPGWTIVDFVEDFNIPRELFELAALQNTYLVEHNVDVIYAGKEAAEEYYTRERTMEALAKEVINWTKLDLINYVEKNQKEELEAWIAKKNTDGWRGTDLLEKASDCLANVKGDTSWLVACAEFTGHPRQWSIEEFLTVFDIPMEFVKDSFDIDKSIGGSAAFNLKALCSSTRNTTDYRTLNPLEIDLQYFIYPENSEK